MKKTWATLGVHRKPQFGIAVNVVANYSFYTLYDEQSPCNTCGRGDVRKPRTQAANVLRGYVREERPSSSPVRRLPSRFVRAQLCRHAASAAIPVPYSATEVAFHPSQPHATRRPPRSASRYFPPLAPPSDSTEQHARDCTGFLSRRKYGARPS